MKKMALVLVFMLGVMFCSCQDNSISESTAFESYITVTDKVYANFIAKVVSPGENAILVEVTDVGNSHISLGSEVWISSPKEAEIDYNNYTQGEYLYVEFGGYVMESYPLQINSVTYIGCIATSFSDSASERKVINIIDKTVNSDICTADALEGFYSDDRYSYYFSSIKSEYVIVEYSDGSVETVAKAINEGSISINDLDNYGIGYYKEPKNIQNIVYHSERGGEADVEEVFYMDSEFVYVFPSIRSEVVIVYYTDGSSQPIKEALWQEKLYIEDLSHFGIEYYSYPKSKYILVN